MTAPLPIWRSGLPEPPMVGSVAVPTMRRRTGRRPPVSATTVSPTCLWSAAKVAGPRTTWSADCSGCPVSGVGTTAAFGRTARTPHLLPVDLRVLEVHPGPVLHVRVVVEQGGRLRGGQVLGPREAGQQHVVPVPPVERGLGDQGGEAGPEDDRGHDHDDGQHRAEDGRAHRRHVAPGA